VNITLLFGLHENKFNILAEEQSEKPLSVGNGIKGTSANYRPPNTVPSYSGDGLRMVINNGSEMRVF
jgi:hypothetical protein